MNRTPLGDVQTLIDDPHGPSIIRVPTGQTTGTLRIGRSIRLFGDEATLCGGWRSPVLLVSDSIVSIEGLTIRQRPRRAWTAAPPPPAVLVERGTVELSNVAVVAGSAAAMTVRHGVLVARDSVLDGDLDLVGGAGLEIRDCAVSGSVTIADHEGMARLTGVRFTRAGPPSCLIAGHSDVIVSGATFAGPSAAFASRGSRLVVFNSRAATTAWVAHDDTSTADIWMSSGLRRRSLRRRSRGR